MLFGFDVECYVFESLEELFALFFGLSLLVVGGRRVVVVVRFLSSESPLAREPHLVRGTQELLESRL